MIAFNGFLLELFNVDGIDVVFLSAVPMLSHNTIRTLVFTKSTGHFVRVDPKGQLEWQFEVVIVDTRLMTGLLYDRISSDVLIEANTAKGLSFDRLFGEPMVLELFSQ